MSDNLYNFGNMFASDGKKGKKKKSDDGLGFDSFLKGNFLDFIPKQGVHSGGFGSYIDNDSHLKLGGFESYIPNDKGGKGGHDQGFESYIPKQPSFTNYIDDVGSSKNTGVKPTQTVGGGGSKPDKEMVSNEIAGLEALPYRAGRSVRNIKKSTERIQESLKKQETERVEKKREKEAPRKIEAFKNTIAAKQRMQEENEEAFNSTLKAKIKAKEAEDEEVNQPKSKFSSTEVELGSGKARQISEGDAEGYR